MWEAGAEDGARDDTGAVDGGARYVAPDGACVAPPDARDTDGDGPPVPAGARYVGPDGTCAAVPGTR